MSQALRGNSMGRFFRGRLALLFGVALAVATALSAGTTAQAANTAVSNAQCSFDPVALCQSTDSTVALNAFYTDTSACNFAWHIAWGDGSVSNVSDIDPVNGSVLLAQHKYVKAGTYTIS